MRFGILCIAIAMLCSSSAARATVIDFNGSPNYAPLTTYTENGFSVNAEIGLFLSTGYFGNPGPSIFADRANSTYASILVSDAGAAFTFTSADLSNDVATAEYTFEGFNGSQVAYDVTGTLVTDQTGYSHFRTYGSGYSDTPITSLLISENYVGGAPDGAIYNDVNIDNIVLNAPSVTPSAITPEPSTFALFGTGVLGIIGMSRRRYI